jgi:hypothetical protein
MRDPVVINAFAKMDRAGELEDIKQLLDPNRPKRNDRFIAEIQPYLADIIGFCSALAIVTKAATGAVGAVVLAKKHIDWVKKRLASTPELPKDLGLRERLLVLLFEATINRGEGLSSEKLKQLLACSTEEFDEAIAGLQQFGVARISIDGDWKYAQPRA